MKMPSKKKEILPKLPDNLKINGVVGPLNITPCGNSAHGIVPADLVGVGNAFLVLCQDKYKENKKTCDICGNEVVTVDCGKNNLTICRSCCDNKCNISGKCPEWKEK